MRDGKLSDAVDMELGTLWRCHRRESEPKPVNAVVTQFHKTSCKNGLVMMFLEVAILDFSDVLGGIYCQIRESLPDRCSYKDITCNKENIFW